VTTEAAEYGTTFREYTAAIYELHEADLPVIQARIAEWLGVSRPSVSEMVHRLAAEGLVTIDEEVRLTDEGRHLAEVVVRRHRLAERFLTEVLGLPWVKVHEEAEVWEHAISDDVEQAMWAKLDEPKTCPHGNPIPGAGYRPPPVEPVAALDERTAVIERISEELELDDEIMDFLDVNDLRPGSSVRVAARTPDGILTVRVNDDAQVGLSTFIAERVYVAKK
jgi:DtxR family transcriptional regulator, Mn-dependent transcriptional regulator